MAQQRYFLGLRCINCDREYDHRSAATLCHSCGGLLDPRYDYDKIRQELPSILRRTERSIWRWRELLPIDTQSSGVTLGEGGTPLLRSPRLADYCGVRELYLKNDTVNPTGSLKDRTVSIAATKALEFGYGTLSCDSTGNKAASVAAYAARAGLKSIVLCPASTPREKLVQAMFYGAMVIRVAGDYTEINHFYKQLLDDVEVPWYDCGTNNPYRYEGKKTYAYEIAEQLEWQVPDRILHPANGGMSIAKNFKGFLELNQLELVQSIPRLSVVQARDYSSIATAAQASLLVCEPTAGGSTIASALAGRDPGQLGALALRAIRESGGTGIAVDDAEISEAVIALAQEGVLTEPSGAVTIAGLRKLAMSGRVGSSERVVCVLTGSGFKNFGFMEERVSVPPVTELSIEAVMRVVQEKEGEQ